MNFPSQRVHRASRRKLGRGQFPNSLGCTVTLTTTGTTNLTMTFSRPVVVTGIIPTTSSGLTIISQTIVSPTVVTQVYSATIAAATVVFPANAANVTTQQGGGVAGNQITF
jgi:hypothetical protein